MEVVIYGKEGCPKCVKAKNKADGYGIIKDYRKASEYTEYHEGWRDDGSVEVKAWAELTSGELPFIQIDGKFCRYEEAMKMMDNK